MKIKLLIAVLFFRSCLSTGQTLSEVKVNFNPVFGSLPFVLEKYNYPLNQHDSIKFETLKFYISDVKLVKDDQVVFSENKSYHLVDASVESSMTLSLSVDSKISWNEIRFNLGIDSTTNVSGAMGGDLDPTKGMYWTWQSGYINLKLEGTSTTCPTRGNEFQFHLGGYLAPCNVLQSIHLKVDKKNPVSICMDLKKYFEAVDLSQQNHVMSPNREALQLTSLVTTCFYFR